MAYVPKVYVGPAGWSYDDWEGIVYPAGLGAKRLDAVAKLFNVIEINSTFYGSPDPRNAALWAERVSAYEDLRFTTKLVKLFTHDPEQSWTLKGRDDFRDGVEPLREAGKLGAVLVQFPWFFDSSDANLRRLGRIQKAFPELPLVLEVRHRSWLEDGKLERVSELGFSFCNVDQPLSSTAIDRNNIVTGPIAYLRLHGRNSTKWFDKQAQVHEKYDYFYSEDELSRLVTVAEELRARSEQLYVVANNHFEGKGPANALEIAHALNGESVGIPDSLVDRYPRLAKLNRPREAAASEPAASEAEA